MQGPFEKLNSTDSYASALSTRHGQLLYLMSELSHLTPRESPGLLVYTITHFWTAELYRSKNLSVGLKKKPVADKSLCVLQDRCEFRNFKFSVWFLKPLCDRSCATGLASGNDCVLTTALKMEKSLLAGRKEFKDTVFT